MRWVAVSKPRGVGPASPPLLSLTWCPCASSPAEQHPAKVQRSAGLVRKRLYALLSQGWWERGSEGETNTHWLTPASTGVKAGWEIPFPSLIPGLRRRCPGFELGSRTAAQRGLPTLLVKAFDNGCQTPLPLHPDACRARHSRHRGLPCPARRCLRVHACSQETTEPKQKPWVVPRSPLNSGGGWQRTLISHRETCV